MARPTLKQLTQSVFAPLVDLASTPSLLDALYTKDLPTERKSDQFRRLRYLKISADDVILLGRNGFLVRFECEDTTFIAISSESFSKDEKAIMNDFLIQEGLNEHYLEECFFLNLKYTLKQFYSLKKDYRNTDSARNLIDIVDNSYQGHDINDLIEFYEEIAIYQVPAQNLYSSCTLWLIACRIATCSAALRSPVITPPIARKLNAISAQTYIPSDNIYTALSAIHWKYIFFELYKCLESVFYLPWHYRLKKELSYSLSANRLASLCRHQIEWRAKEESSIRSLFELSRDNVFNHEIVSVRSFKDISVSPTSKSSFGRRVYKIRNVLVHQQDYDDPAPIDISDDDWEKIVDFMCDVVSDIYTRFEAEMS